MDETLKTLRNITRSILLLVFVLTVFYLSPDNTKEYTEALDEIGIFSKINLNDYNRDQYHKLKEYLKDDDEKLRDSLLRYSPFSISDSFEIYRPVHFTLLDNNNSLERLDLFFNQQDTFRYSSLPYMGNLIEAFENSFSSATSFDDRRVIGLTLSYGNSNLTEPYKVFPVKNSMILKDWDIDCINDSLYIKYYYEFIEGGSTYLNENGKAVFCGSYYTSASLWFWLLKLDEYENIVKVPQGDTLITIDEVVFLPESKDVWSEIREYDKLDAQQILKNKIRENISKVQIFGVTVDASLITTIGPTLSIILIVYLLVYVIHLKTLFLKGEKNKENIPWMPLMESKLSLILSIIIFSLPFIINSLLIVRLFIPEWYFLGIIALIVALLILTIKIILYLLSFRNMLTLEVRSEANKTEKSP